MQQKKRELKRYMNWKQESKDQFWIICNRKKRKITADENRFLGKKNRRISPGINQMKENIFPCREKINQFEKE